MNLDRKLLIKMMKIQDKINNNINQNNNNNIKNHNNNLEELVQLIQKY